MSDTPETIAVSYIEERLQKARKSLKRTQILSIVVMVFVTGYLSTIGYLLKTRLLDPEPAADLATGQVTMMLQQYGPEATHWLKESVPPMVASLPQMLLDQMPAGRELLEAYVGDLMQTHAEKAAADLATHMDTFIAENKETLDAFIEAAQHPEGVEELGKHLEGELRGWLDYRIEGGEDGKKNESIREILDRTAGSLDKLEAKLDRLAHAKDLTEQEKKLRTAIAIIMKTTKEATAAE
jgi:hypothetical protein